VLPSSAVRAPSASSAGDDHSHPGRCPQANHPVCRRPSEVSSLLLDTAKDTVWVAGWSGLSKDQLL